MKREGLQGGGWGQDVTANFLHLFGNLRRIGVLRHNKTPECLQKEVDSAECSLCWRCLLAHWESLAPRSAGSVQEPLVPGGCLCQHCRVFAPHTAAMGKDSWQGLCSCWGDVGGVWELALLAADLGRVTPISTVRSWSRPYIPCKKMLNPGFAFTKSQFQPQRSRSTVPALVSHPIFFRTSM